MATQITINPSDQTGSLSTANTPIVQPSTSVNTLSPKA